MSTPAQHAATVREALRERDDPWESLAALDALQAQAEHTIDTEDYFWLQQKKRLEAAEAERDRWKNRAEHEEDQKRTASKAYLDMQAERDRLQQQVALAVDAHDRLAARVSELEADVEQWRELATFATDKAARAALAGEEK